MSPYPYLCYNGPMIYPMIGSHPPLPPPPDYEPPACLTTKSASYFIAFNWTSHWSSFTSARIVADVQSDRRFLSSIVPPLVVLLSLPPPPLFGPFPVLQNYLANPKRANNPNCAAIFYLISGLMLIIVIRKKKQFFTFSLIF